MSEASVIANDVQWTNHHCDSEVSTMLVHSFTGMAEWLEMNALQFDQGAGFFVAIKSQLSPERQRLLEVMQQINFGRVESLSLERGQPVINPPPRIVREIKFGGENEPRRDLGPNDFYLKQRLVELFQIFDEIKDGKIDMIEIKHGLPFRMSITLLHD